MKMSSKMQRMFDNLDKRNLKTERISFRTDKPTAELIKSICEQTGMTTSETMHFICTCIFREEVK